MPSFFRPRTLPCPCAKRPPNAMFRDSVVTSRDMFRSNEHKKDVLQCFLMSLDPTGRSRTNLHHIVMGRENRHFSIMAGSKIAIFYPKSIWYIPRSNFFFKYDWSFKSVLFLSWRWICWLSEYNFFSFKKCHLGICECQTQTCLCIFHENTSIFQIMLTLWPENFLEKNLKLFFNLKNDQNTCQSII